MPPFPPLPVEAETPAWPPWTFHEEEIGLCFEQAQRRGEDTGENLRMPQSQASNQVCLLQAGGLTPAWFSGGVGSRSPQDAGVEGSRLHNQGPEWAFPVCRRREDGKGAAGVGECWAPCPFPSRASVISLHPPPRLPPTPSRAPHICSQLGYLMLFVPSPHHAVSPAWPAFSLPCAGASQTPDIPFPFSQQVLTYLMPQTLLLYSTVTLYYHLHNSFL